MEKYTVIGLLGEGSYGKVLKCRHKESGEVVAIKKFIETEEDTTARKVALREIRMLKRVHHPHLVCLLEVFRRKKRFHLVFEHMNRSLLEELELEGCFEEKQARQYIYQVIRGIDYCHSQNIIHRDIKPENILISDIGIVKLCDFGFARFASISNEPLTDYVATRWYRPPELLVGDSTYGRAVDIWAVGCILIEMLTGEPLFAGDSDLDQLYQITKLLGGLTDIQRTLIIKSTENQIQCQESDEDIFKKIKLRSTVEDIDLNLRNRFPHVEKMSIDFTTSCLRVNPEKRKTSEGLLKHHYFNWDKFAFWYLPDLQRKINIEISHRIGIAEVPSFPPEKKQFKRRPTNTTSEWVIEASGNDSALFPEVIESRMPHSKKISGGPHIRKEQEGVKCKESGVTKEIVPKGNTILSTSISSQPAQQNLESNHPGMSIANRKKDDIDWREFDRNKDIPKINVEYKRQMMPDTLYMRPVKGRLCYDKSLSYICSNLEKPPSEEICLPQIYTEKHMRSSGKRKNQMIYQDVINKTTQKDTDCLCDMRKARFKNPNLPDV